MLNRSYSLCAVAYFLTGCYTTAPIHWSESVHHDVVQSRTVVPNGSRLSFEGKADNDSLFITSTEVPACRTIEQGHYVMKKSGVREPHTWPATLVGLGVTGGGIALLADGLSEGSDLSTNSNRLIETLAGIGVTAIGAGILGKCVLANCDPDTDLETEYKDGVAFRRWERADRKDCDGGRATSVGNISILISTTWELSDQAVKWPRQYTNGTGYASIPIMATIRSVSEHCGIATTSFQADTLRKSSLEDTPEHPSTTRDDSDTYSIKTKPNLRISSPHDIQDPTARQIAERCAANKQKQCAGSRASSIENKCRTECNSQGGAGYCEEQRDSELQLPDISNDERVQINGRYDICVKEHQIDTSSSSNCASRCIEKALNVICPNPW